MMLCMRLFMYMSLLLQCTFADHENPNGAIQYRPGECLPGDNHKELACPEPEGPEYQACFQWMNQTCCTAEFTEQLATPRVTDIDGFRWDICGNMSQRCHDHFVSVECFYRCSPNVAHWQNPDFNSALKHLPLCREFCDNWFDACADDFTCATNWISDFIYINGENQCLNNTCRTYREVYGNGRGICETLWGSSFLYSNTSQNDPDRQCMTMTWPENQPNPNEVALRNIFGSAVDTVDPATCGGQGLSVWSALVILVTVGLAAVL